MVTWRDDKVGDYATDHYSELELVMQKGGRMRRGESAISARGKPKPLKPRPKPLERSKPKPTKQQLESMSVSELESIKNQLQQSKGKPANQVTLLGSRDCDDYIGEGPYLPVAFQKEQSCGTCGSVDEGVCPENTLYQVDDPDPGVCCECSTHTDCGPPPYCMQNSGNMMMIPYTLCISMDTVHLELINYSGPNPDFPPSIQVWGNIPDTICQLENLESIRFQSQTLYGEIPDCLWNMPLRSIAITGNKKTDYHGFYWPGITGNFPEDIGFRPIAETLQYLSLTNNSLSGPIPDSICGIYVNIPYDSEWYECIDWFSNNCSSSGPGTTGCDPMGPFDPGYDCSRVYRFDLTYNNFCEEDFPNCGFREDDIANQECIESMIGDLNEDGVVNIQDAVRFIDTYMAVSSEPGYDGFDVATYPEYAHYDLNGDGLIDVLDVVILIQIIIADTRTTSADRKKLEGILSRLDGLGGRTRPAPKLPRQQLQSKSISELKQIKSQLQRTKPTPNERTSSRGSQPGAVLYRISDEEKGLIDENFNTVQTWNDVGFAEYNSNVLTDGSLLVDGGAGPSCNTRYSGLHRYDENSNCLWSFNLDEWLTDPPPPHSGYLYAHHDAWPLENGNILIHGSHFINGDDWGRYGEIESGFIMEIQPVGQDDAVKVWEWYMIDHFIQDRDPSKWGYVNNISDYPHMIDINLPSEMNQDGEGADWDFSHFNTIHYHPDLDAVVISSRTIGHGGGGENFIIQRTGPYGGNIIWRCCNSANYGVDSPQLTRHQHGANWIPPDWAYGGDMIIFSNGYFIDDNYAAVLKISNIPYVFGCNPNEPCPEATAQWTTYTWDIYVGPNETGNTIVCTAQCGAFSLPNGNLWVALYMSPWGRAPYEVENPWSGGSIVLELDYDTEPRPIKYIYGCTDQSSPYYNSATPYMLVYDDGNQCEDGGDVYGCMDPTANNYNPDATADDGSCTYDGSGNPCSSHSACDPGEYCHSGWTGAVYGDRFCVLYNDDFCINNLCGIGDGDCDYEGTDEHCDVGICGTNNCSFGPGTEYPVDTGGIPDCCEGDGSDVDGCMDPMCSNYNPDATVDDGSCVDCGGDVYGCMNMNACNYNPEATIDDGSCTYAEENFDCEGNCMIGEDCTGECGGTTVEDECGVCGGDGSSCIEPVPCTTHNQCNTMRYCHSGWNGTSYGERICVDYDNSYCNNNYCGIGDGDCDNNDEGACDHGACGTNNCTFEGINDIGVSWNPQIDCCEESPVGDLNEDGVVDVQDAILFVDTFLEFGGNISIEDYPEYDINGDGVINVLDIVMLINIILADTRTTSAERQKLEEILSRLDGSGGSTQQNCPVGFTLAADGSCVPG